MRQRYTGPRPVCSTSDCDNDCQIVGRTKSGNPIFRKICSVCHLKKMADSHNMSVNEFSNSWHPYRKFKLTHCENIDGRLGFECTTTITLPNTQLEVDHIDGDYRNNAPDNLQTLCVACHRHKGMTNKDHLSPGRKSLAQKI